MAGLKSGTVQLRRGLERKSTARAVCSSAHRPSGWRQNEGSVDVGEAIAAKLVKLLSSDAASSLHSVPLPLLEAPDAELRGAKLLGLDRFRLRPDDPARVLRTDKHLLVHIPLQASSSVPRRSQPLLRKQISNPLTTGLVTVLTRFLPSVIQTAAASMTYM
ncbi:uncharacterized protein LOC119382478 [Rhipicephalus sanguineus]|uniref:uncharacterized protein LOC119382478 n=1 Tax=Rhipicephalus sanguineus TaxID=34632 RepID=UPI0020C425AB|nr:uncharacterized protein LOC119382478 [Rhipicephalus sanguineus]